MKSCTADEFSRVMYGAGGEQTHSDVGCTHRALYWERYRVKWDDWSLVGIERQVDGKYTWEVPNFLYEAYIK